MTDRTTRKWFAYNLIGILVLVACASPEQTPEPVTRKTLPPTWTDSPTSIPSQTQEPRTNTPKSPTATEEEFTETPQPIKTNVPATTTITPNIQETDFAAYWELRSTPMGDGVMTDQVGFHMSQLMNSFDGNLYTWVIYHDEGKATIVYAGVYTKDIQQGKLIVVREGTIWDRMGDHIDIPTRSGRPVIIDAIGQRLIIETEMGDIFYFDVPAGKFADSLTEVLPSMTPGPTPTQHP